MFEYNTVDEALEALRNGEIILVSDDEDRENEGDMICAAQFASTENVNFMVFMKTLSSLVVRVFYLFLREKATAMSEKPPKSKTSEMDWEIENGPIAALGSPRRYSKPNLMNAYPMK